MALKSFGTTNVAWEERVNFERFRTDRLSRIKGLLKESELGALLTFDMNNIRYQTATIIGTWVQDKLARFALLPQDDEPVSWHFGSAARHHQLYCPWLGERSRAGISTLRGATPPEAGLSEDVAKKVRTDLEQRGIQNEPIGVEVVEMEEKWLSPRTESKSLPASRPKSLLSPACATSPHPARCPPNGKPSPT